jgi:hypothetical protein
MAPDFKGMGWYTRKAIGSRDPTLMEGKGKVKVIAARPAQVR